VAAKDDLELIEGKVVVLDGEAFVRKHVRNCVLVYRGGTPPLMQHSVFEDSQFRFEGPARNTLEFLNALAVPSPEMVAVMVGLTPRDLSVAEEREQGHEEG